jgi:N-acetylneuraminic acid mutarotase
MMIASLIIAARPVQAQWEQLPPLPEPNGGFVCGQLEHYLEVAGGTKWQMHDLIIAGGTNWEGEKKNWLTTVRAFDTNGKAWRRLEDLEEPAAYALPLQMSDVFGFAGGTSGSQTLKAMVLFDGLKPLRHAMPKLPTTMVLAAGGILANGRLVFAGGTDDAANLAGVTQATHSLANGQVTRLADYPGKPFATAASAVVGEELLVFGGMNYDEHGGGLCFLAGEERMAQTEAAGSSDAGFDGHHAGRESHLHRWRVSRGLYGGGGDL